MVAIKELKIIDEIINNLLAHKRISCSLPGNGYLFLEHDVPFLIVYQHTKNDKETLKLAKSKASFLTISEEYKSFYQLLCCRITEVMSARFGSFLILEIHAGLLGSKTFNIIGNLEKYPITINSLKTELSKIERSKGDHELNIEVQNHVKSENEVTLNAELLESCGAQLLQLEVPPVFRSKIGHTYPIYFRRFRKTFIKAIQKALFEYTRVQTSSNIKSYTALGKRKVDSGVLKIDKKLYEIQSSYQFLLLVAPTNISEIRQHFFESNTTELHDFHYRMLPVDPDILKRKLFNLKMEDIDDPALAYLFDEKREEIDQELSMLKERGKKGFFQRSVRLYRGLEKSLVHEAEEILTRIPEAYDTEQKANIDAYSFAAMAEEEFEYFRKQSPGYTSKIHIRDDVNIIMVSNGELYLPAEYKMSETEAVSLIQHEIGTHSLTFYNGSQQPLQQMAIGLADYDSLQEGIAVMSEYFAGALTGNRLRIIAGRVIAGNALINGLDFKEMYSELHQKYGFSEKRAFNITSRMLQGGGFLKDIIYLKGLVQLRNYLIEGGNLENLLSGKFAIHHVDVIKELTDRNILKKPAIKPRYMESAEYESKIQKIREGLPIYKLAQL